MKNVGKKLLIGGTVVAAAAAVGAYCYKRYMDDFCEYIKDEDLDETEENFDFDEVMDEPEIEVEINVTEDDFEQPVEEEPAAE